MKRIKATFPKRCTGCELCMLEVQRQLKKVGLEESLIRIFRRPKENGSLDFLIEIDPRVNSLDIEKIKEICPTKVFEITDGESDEYNF